MNKLIRGAQPLCLAAGCQEWTDRYLTARFSDPAASFSWYSRNCYQHIRMALLEMTQDHCAFCDGFLGTEARETVEHFRPKSRYPQQAFQWINLFPCCDKCQSAKQEKYDELLLKPDDADYQFARYFICNYASGELHPAPDISVFDRQRAEKTIELYGLNLTLRKQARARELIKFRGSREALQLDDFPYRYFLS